MNNEEGFRGQKSTSEESGDESDVEGSLSKILAQRQKAVPKRRLLSREIEIRGAVHESGQTKSNAGKLWSETAMIQSLEERIGSGSGTIADLRDRGSETYALNLGKRKRRRQDDISNSLWDEPEAEVAVEQETEETPPENPQAVVDPIADLWSGVDTAAVEPRAEEELRQRPNQKFIGKPKRVRQNHHLHWQQPKGHQKFLQERQKEPFQPKPRERIPAEKFVPRKLLAANYDQSKLYETTLDAENLEDDEFIAALVDALGEQEPELIRRVVGFVGKSLAVELFEKCKETEKRGGMLIKNGERRRTPGGVFMQHFKECETISDEHKKEIFEFGNELQRKRGINPRWWNRKKDKQHRADGGESSELPEILEELPQSNQVLKPDIENT